MGPGSTNQNTANRNQFNVDPNYSDKHSGFVAQSNQHINQTHPAPPMRPQLQVGAQQAPTPIQPQQFSQQYQPRPLPPQAPQQNIPQGQAVNQQISAQPPNNQPSARQEYINPNNFEKVLGKDNVVRPANVPPPPPQIANQDIVAQARTQIPQMKLPEPEIIKPQTKRDPNDRSTLKLIIYLAPVIGLFFLLAKPISDDEFMWHVRNSLVAQGLWFGVLIILNLIGGPIITGSGLLNLAALWNLACYILLVIGGINAYNGDKFKIPASYELGKKFIEGKE